MEQWQRTLYVLWISEFFMLAGMSLVIPFLPVYIEQLGVHRLAEVERWSGLVFAATFMVSALVQPLWGRLSDRIGRKIMLVRSSLGMAGIVAAMGLVHHVWQLFLLRAVMGTVSGFIVAAIALQATQTPKEFAGRALGTLQTGAVAGNLIGPVLGGILAEQIGIRHVFFLTGAILLIPTILVVVWVKERFVPDPKSAGISNREFFSIIHRTGVILPVFVVTMVIQMAYLSIEPIITIYVTLLNPHAPHLTVLAGATFAAIGVGNIVSAPRLGRLADKVGPQKVLWWSLTAAAVLYIPQAFVTSAYQLMVLRFGLGLAVGGLQPAVQALIRRYTPTSVQGRAFGFNSSFMFAGNLIGPVLGGFISSVAGISSVFFVTAFILGLDALWVYRTVMRGAGGQPAPLSSS